MCQCADALLLRTTDDFHLAKIRDDFNNEEVKLG